MRRNRGHHTLEFCFFPPAAAMARNIVIKYIKTKIMPRLIIPNARISQPYQKQQCVLQKISNRVKVYEDLSAALASPLEVVSSSSSLSPSCLVQETMTSSSDVLNSTPLCRCKSFTWME